jgi:hypothetical protein
MFKFTAGLGEPLFRLPANPSLSLEKPVLLTYPVDKGGLQPCLQTQKVIMNLEEMG